VEGARVCVIDSSATLRETIAIVLGADHDVRCLDVVDYVRDPSPAADADILIIADDALPTAALRELPSGRPVLWLQSQAGGPLATAGGRASIPRGFSPEDLRTMVRTLLANSAATPTGLDGWPELDHPMLPADMVQLARRAAATRLPVLICGEPGTGKVRLARAICAAGRQGRFLQFADATCTRHALEQAGGISPGNLTLFVHDVARLSADSQQLLREVLDCGGFTSAAGWHSTRLLCATAKSFSDLARVEGLSRDLFYRLGVLPLDLPPLRERIDDIPALVNRIATDLAHTLETPPITFTARAMERLTHYLWFGNLAELEAVLTRTAALAQTPNIDADDLLFGYGRVTPRRRDTDALKARRHSQSATPCTANVDLIINEIAHEFKNSMVTIKTVTQLMERMLANHEGRQDMTRLTGEAVDRMDRALENLLQFTRFHIPAPQEVTVASLLAPGLSNVAATLSERHVTLDYRPPNARAAFVDAAQIAYALDNLLRVIARDLQEGQTLSIRPLGSSSVLTFEYPASDPSFADRLSDLLDETGSDGGHALPLGLVLAKTLIERNGGHIETRSSATTASVTVSLPNREETAAGNANTTSLSS
jgi:DNA-binding NtrC family response regulator